MDAVAQKMEWVRIPEDVNTIVDDETMFLVADQYGFIRLAEVEDDTLWVYHHEGDEDDFEPTHYMIVEAPEDE